MAKIQIAKTDKSTTTVGCTVMAKPQPDGHKIDENHTTLGCTVMAKPKARQHKINKNHTTLGCTIIPQPTTYDSDGWDSSLSPNVL
ncbi:hypothetical protein J3E69DRAFT_369031 [Trichoderma sp. SZMC 28015]